MGNYCNKIYGTSTYSNVYVTYNTDAEAEPGGYTSAILLRNATAGMEYDASGEETLTFYHGYNGNNSAINWNFASPVGTKMTLLGSGNLGIGTSTPNSKLHICNAASSGTNNYLIIVQNCCTVADSRAGIAFANNSQTPSAGGLSGASIQAANNGIDGTGHLLFGTLLNGANTERIRMTSAGYLLINRTTQSGGGGRLEVQQNAGETGIVINSDSATTNPSLYLRDAGGSGCSVVSSNTGISLTSYGAERIKLGNGCVQINVTNNSFVVNRPSQKLDNNGRAELPVFEINNNGWASGCSGYVAFYYTNPYNLLIAADYDGNVGGKQPNIQFGRVTAPYMHIQNCGTSNLGFIGVGTVVPDTKLTIQAACNDEKSFSIRSPYAVCVPVIEAGTTGADGYLKIRDGANCIWTSLSGYSATPTYMLNSVGIGITSPSYKLHVNGTFYAAGSSVDYKEAICKYNTDSCLFMCLKPVTYQYKDEFKHLGKELKSGTQIGLIAEEVAESHPELAILVNEEDNKVVRNVDYEKLTIILLSELQKLRQEVDQLKNK